MPFDLIGQFSTDCAKIPHLYPALPMEMLDVVGLTGGLWQLLVMLFENLVEALLASTASAWRPAECKRQDLISAELTR